MDKAEIEKIMKLVAEAYEQHGKKVTHAVAATDYNDETGELEGDTLIDNRTDLS